MPFDMAKARKDYARDGVVKLPGVMDAAALADALAAYEWSLANPGPGATKFAQRTDGTFYNDLANPRCLDGYRSMLQASPITEVVADLWDAAPVWFFYEQVFLKEGGETRRTPWHQDSSYLTIAGQHLAVVWITFDAQTKDDSLEFVRGSHKGVLYNGSRFDLDDDTAPINPTSPLPRLPDIQARRDEFDIVSCAVEPGDLIVFHPATLHGGAATHPGKRRRTLTLRYFGPDAVYDERPGRAGPALSGFHQRLKRDDPFRDESFLQLK